MNILKFPVTSEKRFEEASGATLHGGPLFDVDNKNLYIKRFGDMIPIGGDCKQDKLIAGDNIEILPEGYANVKTLSGENGSIFISEMEEGHITVIYRPSKKQLVHYPRIYMSTGYSRMAEPGEAVGLVAANIEMGYREETGDYIYTVHSDSFTNDRYVFICVLANDGTGEKSVPQGILEDAATWGWIHYGDKDKNVVRLKDDIVVRTITVNPDPDNLPDWKSTVKLGELTDGNQIFLITKETEVKDDIQGVIGGELLVKMTTADGVEKYAEYEFTISSTGSWSLWGAVEIASNVRVCKVKWKDEWYYGLKLPGGEFTNVREIYTPTYLPTQTTTERTYVEVDTEGDLHLGFTGRGANAIKLTQGEHLGTLSGYPTVNRDVYSVKVRDLIDNELGLANEDWKTLTQRENAKENQWMKWYEDDESIQFILQNQRYKENAWNIANTSRDINLYKFSNINNQIGDFELYVDRAYNGWGQTQRRNEGTTSSQNQWVGYNTQRFELTLREDGQAVFSSNDPDESELSSYNHWYSCRVQDFEWLLGFNFDSNGEWNKWTNSTRYRLCFRIYNQGSSNNVRITRVQIRDINTTNTNVKDTQGGVEGAILYDFKVTDPDAPFTWANNELINLTQGVRDEDGNVIAYPTYANIPGGNSAVIGNFLDRVANPSAGRMAIKFVVESVTYPSTPDPKVLTPFDTDYLGLHTTEVNGFSSNKIPLFKPWANTGTAILYYGGEGCWSFFGDFSAVWQAIDGYKVSHEYFLDNFDLREAEFWYNGWDLRDPSLIPEQPNDDSQLDYQVLSRESQDDDAFTEIIYCGSGSNIPTLILSKKELGEDAPPYKFVVTGRTLSLEDLRNIANVCKHPDRQICLDLSQCTLADDAKNWNTTIWEGCSSLRKLIVPQGLEQITTGAFVWCTYMRELDLTPSSSSLVTLGFAEIGKDGWSQSIGMMTSTRVRDLMIPRFVKNFTVYLVFSSNVTNMIMLHTSGDEWPSIHQRCFGGIPAGSANSTDQYSGVLPDDFHCFMEETFYTKHPTNYQWNNTSGWWTKEFVDSIVTFKYNWTQEQWQEFNNTYRWGEDLINKVRKEFGLTKDIEIIDYD